MSRSEEAGGATVKCLIWDLDETVWRGSLAESSDVRLFDHAREAIVELDRRGILHAVCSRNDYDVAWPKLESLGLAEYFVAARIGWGAKSWSVREIADELGFAYDTIGFVDDHPAELAEVAFHLPQVRCYSASQIPALTDLPEFSPPVTNTATRRRTLYRDDARRLQARRDRGGTDDDFLRSLEAVLTVDHATPSDLDRLEELTARTGQMNATGVHYSRDTLAGLLGDPAHDVFVARLSDRFGDQGEIGLALMRRTAPVWHLRLLATSCRVIPYGVGTVLLRWLVDRAAAHGVHLVADIRPTGRNRMMAVAYGFAGFTRDPWSCRTALPPDDATPEVRRLHLVPTPQCPPATLRLVTPTEDPA
jgi:methoxymalonate biosynthesis protein